MIEKERFFRAIPYPQLWRENVLSLESLFRLSRHGEEGFAISIGSRYLLRDAEGAHRFGRSTVDMKNAAIDADIQRRGEERQSYVGFYDLLCAWIQEVQSSHYRLEIHWRPEHGRKEHFQLELWPIGSGSRKERSSDRTMIVSSLAARVSGPCIDPAIVDAHLASVAAEMPEGPRGPCLLP